MTSQAKKSTAFIQVDAANFRHLVQQLTGLSGHHSKVSPVSFHCNLSPKTSNRWAPFKLQDRRRALREKLGITLGLQPLDQRLPSLKSPCVGSPGLSPASPLGSESAILNMESLPGSEEEKAVADKCFYLHPSPASTSGRAEPPELLPLFPVTVQEQERLVHSGCPWSRN